MSRSSKGLPVGWAEASLREILLPTSTKDPRRSAGPFSYIDIEAVDNKNQRIVSPKILLGSEAPSRARNAVNKGDVIFSLVRPYLKNIAIVPDDLDDAIASTAFFVCRPASDIDNRFLLNLLRQDSFIAAVPIYGNSPPAARDKEFEMLRVLIPPAPEQRRIAEALDELLSDLDAGVEALLEAQTKLKHYRAAMLKAAVEGQLTAEWRKRNPIAESAPELLERILAERRHQWEEGQLRKFKEKGKELPRGWQSKYPGTINADAAKLPPLPKDWTWATWSQLGFSQNGRAFPSSDYQPQGVRLLRPGNLYPNGKVGWNSRNTRCLPLHYAQDFPELIVRGRELVMNLTAQSLKDEFLGRVCLTDNDEYCLLNQRLARLTPMLSSPEYMLWSLKSPYFREFVDSLNAGSLIQHMFTSQLESATLPLPPLPEQQAIVEALEEQLSMLDHLEDDIENKFEAAQALRQSILHRAFTGQLVPQDPNDEPAEEILKRIAAERAWRTTSTSRRRSKAA